MMTVWLFFDLIGIAADGLYSYTEARSGVVQGNVVLCCVVSYVLWFVRVKNLVDNFESFQ